MAEPAEERESTVERSGHDRELRGPVTGSPRDERLTARMEPFDSFWEEPDDIEKGYSTFGKFYAHNYLPHLPEDRQARILVVSCGPGYFVNLLTERGYENVTGIDSFPWKVEYARDRGLNCQEDRVFSFLAEADEPFDVIIAEQELNHLTKEEVVTFLQASRDNLKPGGRLLVHTINGTSPLTGSESRAGNFDHYCSFTEYSLRQVLEYAGFRNIELFGLNLYVFWWNPLNYIALLYDRLSTLWLRFRFRLVGKDATIFTKKFGATCIKPTVST